MNNLLHALASSRFTLPISWASTRIPCISLSLCSSQFFFSHHSYRLRSAAATPATMGREIPDEDESPRKRIKISKDPDSNSPITPVSVFGPPAALDSQDIQALKEAEVGITDFVSPHLPSFSGILKKRYTDFLVNEILPSGEVLHLANLDLPHSFKAATASLGPPKPTPAAPGNNQNANFSKASEDGEKNITETEASKATATATPQFQLSDEDNKLLEEYFGAETAQQIILLHSRALSRPTAKVSDLGRIKSDVITDKELRTKIHQAIRRIFASRLDSTTESDGTMAITPIPLSRKGAESRGGRGGRDTCRGKLGWSELGGEHLHFTIYKENKDTMEVVTFLARQMKMNAKQFGFAGTKDRRGVTVQRASVYRVYADRLLNVGKSLRNAAVGDFEYRTDRLELGDLNGNEFVITLRDCQFPFGQNEERLTNGVSKATEIVSQALHDLRERGYLNYYGLQRFGTFSTRTDTVGLKMLQGDFKGACECILHFNPGTLTQTQSQAQSQETKTLISADDIARAEAIHIFQTTGRCNEAANKLPRKFSAESSIIRHLGRNKNDYFGALGTIPRSLRLMYVHAYQSLVWNFASSQRWRLYGDKVVAGDLVLINDFKESDGLGAAAAVDEFDADGDVVVLPDAGDSANAPDEMFERARALTAEEAASGKYTIFDIVLPLPGFDILYPDNEMKAFYKDFMSSDRGGKLDPFDMRRSWKDISLSGGYRKLLSKPGAEYSFEVKAYANDDEQFVQTDLDKLKESKNGHEKARRPEKVTEEVTGQVDKAAADKLAVIIKLQLGSSQYATMALRELMKSGGVKTYKPDFGGR
ncbi:pseudouridine synthase [Histoplasma capsulatum G186AR]|nr:pseudouridine synthase [Histoplasma capsulatum]QSS73380.1 pseudouridine synthase [Histoplasma capsulatum G186AR]